LQTFLPSKKNLRKDKANKKGGEKALRKINWKAARAGTLERSKRSSLNCIRV